MPKSFFPLPRTDKPCLAFKVCLITEARFHEPLLKKLRVKHSHGKPKNSADASFLGYSITDSTIEFKDADILLTIYSATEIPTLSEHFLVGSKIIITDNKTQQYNLAKEQPQATVINLETSDDKLITNSCSKKIKAAVVETGRGILRGSDKKSDRRCAF